MRRASGTAPARTTRREQESCSVGLHAPRGERQGSQLGSPARVAARAAGARPRRSVPRIESCVSARRHLLAALAVSLTLTPHIASGSRSRLCSASQPGHMAARPSSQPAYDILAEPGRSAADRARSPAFGGAFPSWGRRGASKRRPRLAIGLPPARRAVGPRGKRVTAAALPREARAAPVPLDARPCAWP